MNRLLSALLWVAVPCAAVACEKSDPDVETDDDSSSSESADDDDEGTGKVDSGKKDAGKADAGKADSGGSGDDDDDDDDDDGTGGSASGGEFGKVPLCEAEAANECEECGCVECADEMAACNEIEGVAAEGPKAGTSKAELCRAVVECGRAMGCRGQACLATDCAEHIFAAGELINDIMASLPTLAMRAMDPMYAVTLSSKVSDCTVMNCTEACK